MIILLGFFGFGIGRAIKLYYLTRDAREYAANVKFPILGLAVTFCAGGVLYRFGGMAQPQDNWVTWLILGGPFVLALLGTEDLLRVGQRQDH